ncbi:MAG: hypothetical protein ACXVA9_03815 [Bdellovibrionales bacterium]
MIALIESLTNNPELRATARILAKEFSARKLGEGLGADPSAIDIEASARLILKRQMLWLYDQRESFSPPEKQCLEELAKIIAKL